MVRTLKTHHFLNIHSVSLCLASLSDTCGSLQVASQRLLDVESCLSSFTSRELNELVTAGVLTP